NNDAHSENRIGDTWRGAFDMRVIPTTWGASAVTYPTGDVQYFDGNGDEMINYLKAPSRLVASPSSGWFLNTAEGTHEFRADGRLVATTSRTGQRIALTYSYPADAGTDGGTGA